jgi:hypothetical protein
MEKQRFPFGETDVFVLDLVFIGHAQSPRGSTPYANDVSQQPCSSHFATESRTPKAD